MKTLLLFGFVVLAFSTRVEAQERYGAGRLLLSGYHLHPVIVDSKGQLVSAPVAWGDDKAVPVAIDFSSWAALSKSMAAGDKIAYDDLRAKMMIIDLPAGTWIQILSTRSLNNIRGYEVRIREGMFDKKVVYMPESALYEIPPGFKLPEQISARIPAIEEYYSKASSEKARKREAEFVSRLVALHEEVMKVKYPRRVKKAAVRANRAMLAREGIEKIKAQMARDYQGQELTYDGLMATGKKSDWKFVPLDKDKKSIKEILQLAESARLDSD